MKRVMSADECPTQVLKSHLYIVALVNMLIHMIYSYICMCLLYCLRLSRLIWLAVHVTTMIALVMILALIWEQFVAQYIVINLYNPLYPIESVAFPSISICSNNRISYEAALAHAKEL